MIITPKFFAAIFLGFEEPAYVVNEDAGVLDDVVFIIKENGRMSEQFLPVLMQLSVAGRAEEGT